MFFNKKSRIENITDKNIIITEIYKTGSRTYQMYCDVGKSSGIIGTNIYYCLKLLTDAGFAVIIDNRQMAIPEVSMMNNKDSTLQEIEDAFKQFKEFANIL